MSAIPTERGTSVQSIFLLFTSFARRVLWTCLGALVARPLHAVAQPVPIRTHSISRQMTSRLRDGT
jgi:hypothetical protein